MLVVEHGLFSTQCGHVDDLLGTVGGHELVDLGEEVDS